MLYVLFWKKILFSPSRPCCPPAPSPPVCARAALWLQQMTTGIGDQASRCAILMLQSRKKGGVAGGLGALGMEFWAKYPKIRLVLSFGAIPDKQGTFWAILGPPSGHIGEREGNRGLFVTRSSKRTRTVRPVWCPLAPS